MTETSVLPSNSKFTAPNPMCVNCHGPPSEDDSIYCEDCEDCADGDDGFDLNNYSHVMKSKLISELSQNKGQ